MHPSVVTSQSGISSGSNSIVKGEIYHHGLSFQNKAYLLLKV